MSDKKYGEHERCFRNLTGAEQGGVPQLAEGVGLKPIKCGFESRHRHGERNSIGRVADF